MGWAGFILLHAHATTVIAALPVLLAGLALAGLLGQVDFARRPAALELGVLGFGLAWLSTALFADDPQRALSLSIPTAIAVVCAIVLPRAEPEGAGLALRATTAALSAQGVTACLAIVLAAPQAAPEALVARAGMPWLVVPNDLAWLGCLWPLWWRWAGRCRRPLRVRCWLLLPCTLLLVAALLVLQSRLGLLVLAVAIAIELGARGRGRRYWPVAAAIVAGAALVLLLGLGKGLDSIGARLQLWQAAWALFLEQPWLGVGPHGFVAAYQGPLQGSALIDPRLTPWPHSLPLELLCSGGVLLGLASVVLFTLRWRAPGPRWPLALGVSGALLCLVEASTLRVWLWFWFVLMLMPANTPIASGPAKLTD